MSNFRTVETTLVPKQFGKRDQRLPNSLKVKATVQLFKPTKPVFKVVPYVSASGKLTPLRVSLAFLADSMSNSNNFANRPVFVSTSLDPRSYETRDNRTVYSDSNEAMVQLIKHEQSPYNSFMVTGAFGTTSVPTDVKTWDNVEHNKHAIEFIQKATAISEAKNLTDLVRKESFEKIWKAYEAVENKLLSEGIVANNAIIVADASSVVPTITLNQTTASRNDFFNAEKVFGNENSLATYAPMVNYVHGSARLSNAKTNGNWTYGFSDNNGLQSYSLPIHMFDFRNKVCDIESRMIIRDRFASNAKEGQRTRIQAIQEFVTENNFITFYEAELRVGAGEHGPLTSVFSIEGDNISYSKAHSLINTEGGIESELVAELDADVTLDMNKASGLVTEAFNAEDFLASLGTESDDEETLPETQTEAQKTTANTLTIGDGAF